MEEDARNTNLIESVVHRILEDTQQRLVFRGQAYIREEIEGFAPRDEELAILARGRGLPQPTAIQTSYSVAPVLATPATDSSAIFEAVTSDVEREVEMAALEEDEQEPSASAIGKLVFGGGEWYPTLYRTLYILGKLYRCVPNAVFEDLAQEAVECCRRSLVEVAQKISTKETRLDGQFFLMKNLLMLREHITPYTVGFVRKEDVVDLAHLRDAVSTILQAPWGYETLSSIGKGLMSAGTPVVVESYADAKQVYVVLKCIGF